MYGHSLKVYGEDLYKAGTSGVVNGGGTMGSLVVNLVAINDASSFGETTVTVKQGASADNVTSACGSFTSEDKTNVKAGDVIATWTPAFDVETFLTATVEGETTNARVTLGYLPR